MAAFISAAGSDLAPSRTVALDLGGRAQNVATSGEAQMIANGDGAMASQLGSASLGDCAESARRTETNAFDRGGRAKIGVDTRVGRTRMSTARLQVSRKQLSLNTIAGGLDKNLESLSVGSASNIDALAEGARKHFRVSSHGAPDAAAGKRDVGLFWFRRNLRLLDNPLLYRAAQECATLAPVYIDWSSDCNSCLESRKFTLRSVEKLREALRQGVEKSDVIVRKEAPHAAIPQLCRQFGVTRVYLELGTLSHERDDDCALISALRVQLPKIEVISSADGTTLHSANAVARATRYESDGCTNRGQLPAGLADCDAFEQMLRSSHLLPIAPCKIPDRFPPLPVILQAQKELLGNLDDSRQDGEVLQGGESEALRRLDEFVQGRSRLSSAAFGGRVDVCYGALSPYLYWGCVSSRTVFAELRRHAATHVGTTTLIRLQCAELDLILRDFLLFSQILGSQKDSRARMPLSVNPRSTQLASI